MYQYTRTSTSYVPYGNGVSAEEGGKFRPRSSAAHHRVITLCPLRKETRKWTEYSTYTIAPDVPSLEKKKKKNTTCNKRQTRETQEKGDAAREHGEHGSAQAGSAVPRVQGETSDLDSVYPSNSCQSWCAPYSVLFSLYLL